MTDTIWAGELDPDGLSQGDVVEPLLIALPVHPAKNLSLRSFKGGTQAWAETTPADPTQRLHWLAQGRFSKALVMSHSCLLDKQRKSPRVHIAPISPIDSITDVSARENVLARRHRSLMPLLGCANLADSYADLRLLTYVDRAMVGGRLASMTAGGRAMLQEFIVGFFVRDDAI